MASDQLLKPKSDKDTYPIFRLNDNYQVIKAVYKTLNEHIKIGIPIHPAGEWVLDNFYIVEEIVKNISKELTLKKYMNFVSVSGGRSDGFARIYVLASEMVAFTDGVIFDENLESMLKSYQSKKQLSMEEIWNIGTFIQIALIENIRQICEKIYFSQIQKLKVEEIIGNTIEKKDKQPIKNRFCVTKNYFKISKKNKLKYSFIEYMSYRLKKYGRTAYPYLRALENEVNKAGLTVEDVIKKEHFDVANKKVSIGNAITSLKEISRINFLEIFERINGVEEILNKDPAGQYEIMDAESKVYYRNAIAEISKKTKLSEIYIANKSLELSQQAETEPRNHVGYYLISNGKQELINTLLEKHISAFTNEQKTRLYICGIVVISILLTSITLFYFFKDVNINSYYGRTFLSCLLFFLLILPIGNAVTKIIQFISSKIVKPKLIPKLNFENGIPEEYSTMVVIPTILKSSDQVKKLFEKLEVFYIANKSENIYFTLLGDCSSSSNKIEDFDDEIIKTGQEEVIKLNDKYKDAKFCKFNFIYRNRIWNEKENCYLGWERKRGLLDQFNEYLLKKNDNPFRVNTIELYKEKIPNIKYIITLDCDTDLVLNSGIKLIEAMAHILNKPHLNKENDLVISGHGIIAPRVGIGLQEAKKNIFTILYAGQGGTDSYTNAISDMYQDNFDEGIYAGKGIYDLQTFSKVLNGEIKENTVLSHDLLEGCYMRSGFASDIMLMDGYPSNYISARKRLYRWIRGDWQIVLWLNNTIRNKNGKRKRNPLKILSKFKILCNIFRSKQEEKILELLILFVILYKFANISFLWICFPLYLLAIPTILEIINSVISKSGDTLKTKSFTKNIPELSKSIYRLLIEIGNIPDKVFISFKAQWITLHRMYKSHKRLLEWETSEETERKSVQSIKNYYKEMKFNLILGGIGIIINLTLIQHSIIFLLCVLWLLSPFIMYYISRTKKEETPIDLLKEDEKKLLNDLAYKTWQYFKDTILESNNYLPPDNYQEDRKIKFIPRTSSTNIGLAALAIISSYDLKYETLENTIELLKNMIDVIERLPKWNGHLYNWYDIKELEPLIPKFISSVDSGNFVGYMYVLLQFLIEAKEKIESSKSRELRLNKVDRRVTEERNLGNEKTIDTIDSLIEIVKRIIVQTDFSKLYDKKTRLFSVGFNTEENKLVESYYDLLASEARQTSLVAIAKKDVSYKHWNNLSRTLTTLNGYKGLISWSGTAFEYLMPSINIPNYSGSLLDESCKFLLMSQKEYARKLEVPWGFSEAAFNLKDLNNNYQYKSFGIPWLGLKRGLADEIVVSSYGSILAINECTEDVITNIRKLEESGMYGKYGLYESIDYTPSRVKNKSEIVKTYMAHHQGLILLSINNLINHRILQKRFMKNPEIQAVNILLEEKMPDNMILTKEEKEKIEKIKSVDYDDYSCRVYSKLQYGLNISNAISNDEYVTVVDQYGNGYSMYKDIQINRFKLTDEEEQGILFYIKDINNKRIWTNTYSKYLSAPDKYAIEFYPDMCKFSRVDGGTKTTTKTIIAPDDPVEIRTLEIFNSGVNSETLEITSYIEPILSEKFQDYSHKAFNNLFLTFSYEGAIDTIIVKRKSRDNKNKEIYLAVKFFVKDEQEAETEFELDKEKFNGRCNMKLPNAIANSNPFSRKIENTTDPIIAIKKVITVESEKSKVLNLIMAVGESKEDVIKEIIKYTNSEKIDRTFELSKARVSAENRYLGIKGKDVETYQRMLSYLIFPYLFINKKIEENMICKISDLWKYGISGDLPILLVKINNVNDIDVVKEVIDAYEYYKTKNVKIDLVILNEEKENYENYVKDAIHSIILNKNLGYMQNIDGGIFCLNSVHSDKDKKTIEAKAKVIIDSSEGKLLHQIDELENNIHESIKQIGYDAKNETMIIEEKDSKVPVFFDEKHLMYFNEYGGFSKNRRRIYY